MTGKFIHVIAVRVSQPSKDIHGLSLAYQPPINLVLWGCKIHSRVIQYAQFVRKDYVCASNVPNVVNQLYF